MGWFENLIGFCQVAHPLRPALQLDELGQATPAHHAMIAPTSPIPTPESVMATPEALHKVTPERDEGQQVIHAGAERLHAHGARAGVPEDRRHIVGEFGTEHHHLDGGSRLRNELNAFVGQCAHLAA